MSWEKTAASFKKRYEKAEAELALTMRDAQRLRNERDHLREVVGAQKASLCRCRNDNRSMRGRLKAMERQLREKRARAAV